MRALSRHMELLLCNRHRK